MLLYYFWTAYKAREIEEVKLDSHTAPLEKKTFSKFC